MRQFTSFLNYRLPLSGVVEIQYRVVLNTLKSVIELEHSFTENSVSSNLEISNSSNFPSNLFSAISQ